MNDRTKLLSALPGFRVRNVTLAPDGGCLVRMKGIAAGGGRSACGGLSSWVSERPTSRLKDRRTCRPLSRRRRAQPDRPAEFSRHRRALVWLAAVAPALQ
jgi:hypothetical protein